MPEPVSRLLFTNVHVYTPEYAYPTGWLLTDGARIRLIGPGEPPPGLALTATRIIDGLGQHLLPGFIDLHVHGACGCDTMVSDGPRSSNTTRPRSRRRLAESTLIE